MFFMNKYPSQQSKANEFCKIVYESEFYNATFFNEYATGKLKLDKNCILKDANSEEQFKKVIAQFLEGVKTGDMNVEVTEFVPGSTEAPSAEPKAAGGKKNKKKNKKGKEAAAESPQKKAPSAGEEATDESPLKPANSASIEDLVMKPKPVAAKGKPTKRDATLNLSEQLLGKMKFLGGNAPS